MIEPLTTDERERLRRFAEQEGGPSWAEMLGTLHAVATAPRLIPPSEWLPGLIGQRELEEATDVQLFVRLYDEVARSFDEGTLEVPSAHDDAAIREFCRGYVRVAMADRAWRGNEEATVTCFPLLCLARGKRPSELGSFPAIHDDEAWLDEQRAALEATLAAVHRMLAPQRLPAPQPRAMPGAKLGRNDPCPCGSGRKYKKCCLLV